MWAEFHPRHAQKFGSHPAADGDLVGHHQIRCKTLQHRTIEYSHPGSALMDLSARVGVIVDALGFQAGQLDCLDTGGARSVETLAASQQNRVITGRLQPKAQCDRRERVPGLRPGDHGDAHGRHGVTSCRVTANIYEPVA